MIYGDPIPQSNPNVLPIPRGIIQLLPELGSITANRGITTAEALVNNPHGSYGYLLPRLIQALEQVTIVGAADMTNAIGGIEYDFVVGTMSKESSIQALLLKGNNGEIAEREVAIEREFINRFPDGECIVVHYHPSGLLMKSKSHNFFSKEDVYSQIKQDVKPFTQVLVTQNSDRIWIIKPIAEFPHNVQVALNLIPEIANPDDLEQMSIISQFLFRRGYFLCSASLSDKEHKVQFIR